MDPSPRQDRARYFVLAGTPPRPSSVKSPLWLFLRGPIESALAYVDQN